MHNQNQQSRLLLAAEETDSTTSGEYGTMREKRGTRSVETGDVNDAFSESSIVKEIQMSVGESDKGSQTTDIECLMHLLKGMLGTGILAMPAAFSNGGLWFSLFTVLFLGFISTHCMNILVNCRNILAQRLNEDHLDYARVFEKAFATRTDGWKKYDRIARLLVNIFLVITQIGFCCIYTVFVAQNVQQVLEYLLEYSWNGKLYVLFVSLCLVPYFMVKSLKALVPFSSFANVLNCLGLVIVLYDLFQDLPDVSVRQALPKMATLPIFFGQAVFSFEGIGLVLPLHYKMKDRAAFLGWVGVLNFGLTVTVCLYAAVGFYGYLKYGSAALGSITLNLPSDVWVYLVAKLMFAVSIFITCGIQFYVPINIVWPAIVRKCTDRNIGLPKYAEYAFRILLIIIIGGVSALVPHLDLLISLVGACASSFLLLIFPPVIELFTLDRLSKFKLFKNFMIVFVGLIGFATGTFSSLKDIVNTF